MFSIAQERVCHGSRLFFWELHEKHGIPFAGAFAVAVAATAGLGVLTQALIMRRLRNASALARLIAALGVLITLEGVATIRYGGTFIEVACRRSTECRPHFRRFDTSRPAVAVADRRRVDIGALGRQPVHHHRTRHHRGGRE